MNLSGVVSNQENRELECENMYKICYEKLCKQNGENHLMFIRSAINLGICYTKQNKFDLAEALLKKAVAIQENIHGPESKVMLSTKAMLVSCYYHQVNNPEKLAEREKIMKQCYPQFLPGQEYSSESAANLLLVLQLKLFGGKFLKDLHGVTNGFKDLNRKS